MQFSVKVVSEGQRVKQASAVTPGMLTVPVDTKAAEKFPLALSALKTHNILPMKHSPNDLIMLFNDLFRETFRTVLVRGGEEPEYLPADSHNELARIVFAHGFYASALHEVSHWCIAGKHRRTLHDYGYWYCPDGRTAEQQKIFEQVEVKPQAIEWLLSVAAGSRFHISVDNLSGAGACDQQGFAYRVLQQAEAYLANGLPERAQAFFDTLTSFYGTSDSFSKTWREDVRRVVPLHFAKEHYEAN